MKRQIELIAGVIAGCLALSSAADATVIRFILEDAIFNDGGTATGSFEYDTVTDTYSNIDIVTTAGTALNGNTYTSYSPLSTPRNYGFGSVVAGGNAPGDPLLDINTTSDFTMPGTVSLGNPTSFISAEGVIFTDDIHYVAKRNLTGSAIGAIVPEPATWALMLVGMGMVGSVIRRRKTTFSFA